MRIGKLAVVAALAWSGLALADSYPSRPITFVVPSSAGGGMDVLARALAQEMGKQMKQAIVVDNRPGAVGMLGASAVAKSKPYGYTVLITHSAPVLNAPFLYSKVPYDARRDFAYVSKLTISTVIVAVNGEMPARTVKSFLDWAGQHKGTVSYGSYGIGSLGHLMGSYMSQSKRLDMTHVAYKGEAPMVQGLVGGEVRLAMGTLGSLAIRSNALKDRLKMLGMEPVGNSSDEFRREFEREAPMVGKRVKESGATVE
ncbi:Tripartite tricarboxylate transporter family receptor [compost metagenome]